MGFLDSELDACQLEALENLSIFLTRSLLELPPLPLDNLLLILFLCPAKWAFALAEDEKEKREMEELFFLTLRAAWELVSRTPHPIKDFPESNEEHPYIKKTPRSEI